jgi:para-nitrobenzyl esterase
MWTWARLQSGRAWFYHFKRQPPFPEGSAQHGWGASHFAELWYVFDHLGQEAWPWRPSDRILAERMSSYWTNFARGGDPNGKGLPRWPVFDARARVLLLDESTAAGELPGTERLQVFDAVYTELRRAPMAR